MGLKWTLVVGAALFSLGCAHRGKELDTQYFTEVQSPVTRGKSPPRFAGWCETHGILTNCTPLKDLVNDVVEAHNKKYHSDDSDPTRALIRPCPPAATAKAIDRN